MLQLHAGIWRTAAQLVHKSRAHSAKRHRLAVKSINAIECHARMQYMLVSSPWIVVDVAPLARVGMLGGKLAILNFRASAS